MGVRLHLIPVFVASVMLAACTGARDAPPSSADPTGSPAIPSGSAPIETPSTSAQPPSPDAPSRSSAAGAVLDQPWATATLINVTTGEPFRIADIVSSGKVVFLETMAIWCSNCRAQQREATAAFQRLDPGRVEWVAIDVESAETAEALARYREDNGFPFTYAIADAASARALVAEFGDTVLSPPSVNVIVIDPDGRVVHLLGHKSADEIHDLATERGA